MLDFILHTVITLLAKIFLLPISAILATPILIVVSGFGKENYSKNLKSNYHRIFIWWNKYL